MLGKSGDLNNAPEAVMTQLKSSELEVIEERASEGTPNFMHNSHFAGGENLSRSEYPEELNIQSINGSVMRDTFLVSPAFKSQVGDDSKGFEYSNKTKVSLIVDFTSTMIQQANLVKRGVQPSLGEKSQLI